MTHHGIAFNIVSLTVSLGCIAANFWVLFHRERVGHERSLAVFAALAVVMTANLGMRFV